jgi:hypothetical protein
MLKYILAAVVVVIIGGYAVFTAACPCDRIPGGYLLGNEVTEPVSDWAFANEEPLCQIEVFSWHPHSVNLNCMSAEDGELYLSCSGCEGKYWSTIALDSPNGRLRIGDNVYPVTMMRVTDPETLDIAWKARAAKTGRGADTERADHWWSFRLESR